MDLSSLAWWVIVAFSSFTFVADFFALDAKLKHDSLLGGMFSKLYLILFLI